jgi:hypothetical protein
MRYWLKAVKNDAMKFMITVWKDRQIGGRLILSPR